MTTLYQLSNQFLLWWVTEGSLKNSFMERDTCSAFTSGMKKTFPFIIWTRSSDGLLESKVWLRVSRIWRVMSKFFSVCELISVFFDTSIIESMFNGVKKLRKKRKDSLKKTGSMQLFLSVFMHEHNASIHTRHQNSCQYDVYDKWHYHHISWFVSPSDRMTFNVVSSWDESDATSTR